MAFQFPFSNKIPFQREIKLSLIGPHLGPQKSHLALGTVYLVNDISEALCPYGRHGRSLNFCLGYFSRIENMLQHALLPRQV